MSTENERLRLFLALPLTPALCEAILSFQVELTPRLSSSGVELRPSRAQDLHITMAFFASVEALRLGELLSAASTAAAATVPFLLQLRGVGAFPRASAARVIWAGLSPSEALTNLYERLASELESRGFPREQREFQPHLTIARLRGNPSLEDEIRGWEQVDFGSFESRELCLYRSSPGLSESQYQVLERFSFGKS